MEIQVYFVLFISLFSGDILCKKRGHRVKTDDGKIVGGTNTTIETYPYQAYLLVTDGSDYYQCGGSIVNRNYVVTAAHCLTGMNKVYVRIGSTDSDSGGTQYESTTFFRHPLYNSGTSDYDVGVIRTRTAMALDGTSAKAIRIVNSGYEVPDGEDLVVTGWGATSENGNVSRTLMVVDVPAVSRSKCNEQLGGGITSRMICAGVPEGGKDTCQGDSGGPAVVKASGNLVGATSFGYGCARVNSPGVYTNLGNRAIRLYIRMMTGA